MKIIIQITAKIHDPDYKPIHFQQFIMSFVILYTISTENFM